MNDNDYMRQAIALARKGAGRVNPNPLVGAVIVRDGVVLGTGYHTAFGKPHAEREALAACAERGLDPAGATVYVTLEPCCHEGKQPPCTRALIAAHVARVVVGASDPNPLVAGKGVAQLRAAGIQVDEDVLADECRALCPHFFHYIRTGRPYVIMKYAMTLDGKIATRPGVAQWITGAESVARVHQDRNLYAAILVGVDTVLVDDPLLTCRIENTTPAHPLRVVADTHARTPLNSRLVSTAHDFPTLIAVGESAPRERTEALRAAGCDVVVLREYEGHASMEALVAELGKRGIDSLIVEGGPTLHGTFALAGLVNRVQVYIVPRIFGGSTSAVTGKGFADPSSALHLENLQITPLGQDLLVEGEVI